MKGELNERDQCYADLEALEHDNKELLAKNGKMHEALNYAYEILASVETKYPSRDSAIGQFKMAGIRSLLKELKS